MEHAIRECIDAGILETFLRKNRAEVMDVSIFEYNAEEEIRKYKLAQQEFWKEQWREQWMAEGMEEGRREGEAQGKAEGLAEGHATLISLIYSLLQPLGEIPLTLEAVLEEKTLENLSELVILASKVQTIDEFLQKCL